MSYDPTEVQNAFDPAKHYHRIHRRDSWEEYMVGQAENEADSMRLRQIENIGRALLPDGTVTEGAAIVLDPDTGACTVAAGKVAAFGFVREPAGAALTVPTIGQLSVGIWIERRMITTRAQDPDIRFLAPNASGLPANDTDMAAREQQLARWGLSTEENVDTADVTYAYVAVYRIKDGVVIRDTGTRPAWMNDLAEYDVDAHGSYSVRGMQVTALGKTGSDQIFSIAAGVVNANGEKIRRDYDLRHAQVEAPPIRAVQGERHAYVDAAGSCVVTVRNKPISSVQRVEILKERTVALTKGLANTMDALPDAAVDSLISVVQGGTTYVATTDYVLSSDKVSWAPGGAEPAPGSTYNVTYRYYAVVAATAVGSDTITVTGAVSGSQVTLDYSYKVRRIDAISIEPDGDVVYTLGPVNHLAPQPPSGIPQSLTLAQVDNNWLGTPTVTNLAPPANHFDQQALDRASLADLRSIVSRLALQVALGADQASSRDRQFVDAMSDDSQRDLGIAQTAAVAGGVLRLPIAVSVQNLAIAAPVIPARTYSRVRTLEASDGTLTLGAAERYGVMTIAERFDPRLTGDGVVAPDTLLLARSVTPPDGAVVNPRMLSGALGATARFRAQTLNATVTGVTPAATLTGLTFAGLAVAPTGGAADGSGVSAFSFAVPANQAQGTKEIVAEFSDGTRASVRWSSGQGQQPNNRSTHIRFRLPALGEWIGRIQLRVDDVGGTEPIYWALSEVYSDAVEYPFRTAHMTPLADGLVPMVGVADGDWITITPPPMFGRDRPVMLHLSSVSPHKLRTAPADDTAYGSLNTSGRTLLHRVDAAVMTPGVTTFPLGTVAVAGVTDLAVAADTWLPGDPAQWAEDVRFVLSFGGESYTLDANKGSVPLPAAFTGNVDISALLTVKPRYQGKAGSFAFLWPRVQLLTGIIQTSGTYVTRSQAAMTAQTLSAFFTAFKDADATIVVEARDSAGTWQAMTQASATALGNGWFDFRFNKAGFTSTDPRVRITLGGDVAKRIYLDNLRVVSF